MNRSKEHAAIYSAVSLGLFGFWLQASGWEAIVLFIFALLSGLVFLSLALSLHFKWKWLIRIADRLSKVRFGQLTWFLGLSSLSIGIAQKGYSNASIGVFLIAYALLLWGFIPRRASK